MKKANKLLSLVFIFICGSIFTLDVDAAGIKESSADFTGDVYVIGSTKFDNNTIITATRAAQAGSDEAALRILSSNDFRRVDVKTYYYNELEETWFLVPEEGDKELGKLTEKEVKELEDNLKIYFVNNQEKSLEVEYSGNIKVDTIESTDSITGAKVTYKDGKFFIPVTVIDVWFETSSGEEVYITTDYDNEKGFELGEFYIPISVLVLDENGVKIPDIYVQANNDGVIEYTGILFDPFRFNKTGYSLYYVDTNGKKIDFSTFKVTENTSIKQVWNPKGNAYTDEYVYENEDLIKHKGVLNKNNNGYYIPVTLVAPSGYNTTNTKVNGKLVTFKNEMAMIELPITQKGVETSMTVQWEEGIEVTFKFIADESSKFIYNVTYYDAENNIFGNVESHLEGDVIYEPMITPTKEGFVFEGWTTNQGTKEKYNFKQVISSDLKLYPIFTTVEEIIESSSVDNPAKLSNDVTLTETIILDVDKDMVLDLNGHTITSDGKHAIRLKGNDASLTIKNGTFNVTGAGAAVAIGESQADTTNVIRRNLIIEPTVFITGQYYGLAAFGKSQIDFYGRINILEDGYGISGNGSKNNEGTVFNIYPESIITATNGSALYLPQTGKTNISGGTLEAHTVVGIKAGDLNITGGTFRSVGDLNVPNPNSNGFDFTGDIILVEENADYANNVVINITGGTFDNLNGGSIIKEYNPSIGTNNEMAVTVKGIYATRQSTDNEHVFVYVDSNLAKLEINGVKYTLDKLKYAIENSSLESAVTLLDDITLTETIVLDVDKDMVLDLNGHTITSDGKHAIRLKGTDASLTVKNGTFNVTGAGAAVAIGESQADTTSVVRRNLIIEPTVSITGQYYGLAAFGKSQIDFYGHINILEDGYGISGNGSKNNEGTVFNIYPESIITATNGSALYLPQTGKTNISGGTLEAHTVVGIKAGNLNITGGSFKAVGDLNVPNPNSNGFDFTGDIILVEENADYANNVVIDITGGTFDTLNGGSVIKEYNPSIGTNNERTLTVKGMYATRQATDNEHVFIYVNNN